MEGYLAGCNMAVSPFAGTAEKDEKKSAKDTRGTVFSMREWTIMCALYVWHWSVCFPPSHILDREKQPAPTSEYESIKVIYRQCK